MNEEIFKEMWYIMRQDPLEIIDDIGSDCRCTICKRIMINACNTICGCRFCLDCIKEFLRDEKRMCPGGSGECEVEMINIESDIQQDRPINKKISKLKAKCPNVGCQAEMELIMMANHLRSCDKHPLSCPYLELGCEEQKLVNDRAGEHLLSEIYSHTTLMMSWMNNSRNEMESLKTEIKQLRADNKVELLKAELDQLRADNEDHKEQTRRDREKTDKIIQELLRKEKENIRKIEILNEEICTLKHFNGLKIVKDEQAEQISQLKALVKIHTIKIDQLRQRGEQTETKCDENHQKAQKSLDMQKKRSTQSMETAKSMQILPEIIGKNVFGDFEWKIDNWLEKVNDARNSADKEIFSNSFFSHQNGYKICLSVVPRFGDYFGIYFYIMRGPFDDFLQWPFNEDLEVSLINQETNLAYKTKLIKCSDYPNYLAYQKPSSERNSADIVFPFISLQEASYSEMSSLNQIFIKCSVKPAEHQNRN